MRVYLADLGHNLLTLSSDVYPLGIANLASYALERLAGQVPLEFRIFREPQDLKAALDEEPPDVLGLSNYAWNHQLMRCFARYARRRDERTLVVTGGPNWPLTLPEQEAFVRSIPEVDIFVEGHTYEGEVAFCTLLQRIHETERRREALLGEAIPGNVFVDRSGNFVKGPEVPRILDLDEIPSPYRRGLLDDFFCTGYFPLLQVARGCPFSCTFCNSGVAENNHIYAHSIEEVQQDLLYIAERVKPEITLCLADDNFGMYRRDEEVADFLAHLQDKYGWPRYIRTTTGKNNATRIIKVMRKVRGALPMTAAVQSLNPTVLANIKRSNIKLETYRALQQELRRQGMQSYGELILCLPGETKQSFLDAVRSFLEAGAQRISAHQLMLLHGAELATPASRRKFGFETRFRIVARNIGNYTGEPVIETEEMVVATPTFSFDDYLECRVFHLLLTIFCYEGNYEEAFEYAKSFGLGVFDVAMRLQRNLDHAPPAFRQVVDEFLRESHEELFETEEECLEWARDHYAGLVDGTLGGNLLSKYSMIGRFYVTHEGLAFLESTLGEMLRERTGAAPPIEELRAVIGYLESTTLHAPFADAMSKVAVWTADYDVERWRDDGYRRPLSAYPLPAGTRFRAVVDPDKKSLLETKIATFGEHPAGLGKFTRTMFARDLRRRVVRDQPA